MLNSVPATEVVLDLAILAEVPIMVAQVLGLDLITGLTRCSLAMDLDLAVDLTVGSLEDVDFQAADLVAVDLLAAGLIVASLGAVDLTAVS